jgi:hypothetical protein
MIILTGPLIALLLAFTFLEYKLQLISRFTYSYSFFHSFPQHSFPHFPFPPFPIPQICVVNHGQSDETQGLKIPLKSLPGVRVPQITPRDRQHVLGGVKRCEWSRRLPWNTKLRKGALLDPIHMVLALISPRVGAAVLVTGIGGCIEPKKSQAQLVVHVCARYSRTMATRDKYTCFQIC